jgi:hypothetical protein
MVKDGMKDIALVRTQILYHQSNPVPGLRICCIERDTRLNTSVEDSK